MSKRLARQQVKRAAMWVGAVPVAAAAAAVSFTHIASLAVAYGGTGIAPDAVPVCVDALIAIGELMLMHEADGKGKRFWIGWGCIFFGIAVSLTANMAFGLRVGGVGGGLFWTIPSVSLTLVLTGMIQILKRSADRDENAVPAAAQVSTLEEDRWAIGGSPVSGPVGRVGAPEQEAVSAADTASPVSAYSAHVPTGQERTADSGQEPVRPPGQDAATAPAPPTGQVGTTGQEWAEDSGQVGALPTAHRTAPTGQVGTPADSEVVAIPASGNNGQDKPDAQRTRQFAAAHPDMSQLAVAAELGISPRTVRRHLSALGVVGGQDAPTGQDTGQDTGQRPPDRTPDSGQGTPALAPAGQDTADSAHPDEADSGQDASGELAEAAS